jgi:predicted DNA-binding transcriptional regulator AlpA
MKTVQLPFQITVEVSQDGLGPLISLVQSLIDDRKLQKASQKRSMHARLGGNELPTEHGLLLDTRDVAKLLKVSTRTIFSMHTKGRMPAPIRIGFAVRWPYKQLCDWVEAGCPKIDRHK